MAPDKEIGWPDSRTRIQPEMLKSDVVPEAVEVPSRLEAALFRLKATLLQVKRMASDSRQHLRRFPQDLARGSQTILASSSSPLWTDERASEQWYQLGKVQNIRLAAKRLNGTVVPAGGVFSFWRTVGRPTKFHGYVEGRMLQQGCMVPSIGGGLCQLSNALYGVALLAGCEIVERHAHSRIVPGSATAVGRDATVAWNYVDLRFRCRTTVRINVQMTSSDLIVSLEGEAQEHRAGINLHCSPITPFVSKFGCDSCGRVQCFRHGSSRSAAKRRTAFLLDAAWPEFRRFVSESQAPHDAAAIPIRGKRWRRPNYDWPTADIGSVRTATITTLQFALASRRLAHQGAARQRALLDRARKLSATLAGALDPDIDNVVVSQSLLPFLWMSGDLGGRGVHVLMTGLPMASSQLALDAAAEAHPESPTLLDFRAPSWLTDYEDEALECAERIITPHSAVAALFAHKLVRLPWDLPLSGPIVPRERSEMPVLYFPGPTVGRKGAYEVREAAVMVGAKVWVRGPQLEGDGFWQGVNTEPGTFRCQPQVDAVVAPSILESQPRELLRMMAAKIPVIATDACGLVGLPGVITVPILDSQALARAILDLRSTGMSSFGRGEM